MQRLRVGAPSSHSVSGWQTARRVRERWREKGDGKVCPRDPEGPISPHGGEHWLWFLLLLFCCALCPEMTTRELECTDFELIFALNRHQFDDLQEKKKIKVRRESVAAARTKTPLCVRGSYAVVTFVLELCFEFSQQKRCRLLTPHVSCFFCFFTDEYVLGV